MEPLSVAYLCSEYPGISHTFVLREVEAVRRDGIRVCPCAFRRPKELDRMTDAERAEAESTFYLDEVGLAGVLMAHGRVFTRWPGGWVRILRGAAGLARRGLSPWSKVAAYFAGAGVLADWMRRSGMRHVHVHLANPAATVAMLAAQSGIVTFSLSVHGPDVFFNVDTNYLREKAEAAVFVRCISHFCTSQMIRLVPFAQWGRFHIVRCGVDTARYAPRPEPGNSVPEILCVGRLVPAKGQHVLLQACRILKDRGQSFHVTFVGDGPDRRSLDAAARDFGIEQAVTFAGAVGQDAIHAYYDRADLFVLPTFAEGLPVVLMEAMAKGIACVTSYVAGIPELIQSGVNGILLAPSGAEALADALGNLLTDGELRSEMGRKGREAVLAAYDNARNAPEMARLFRHHAEAMAKVRQ